MSPRAAKCTCRAPSPLWGEGWGEGQLALDVFAVVRCAVASAGFRWPGLAPAGRPAFLHAQESRQRKRPHVCDPCASLRGKPASQRLRGARWNSLRSLRSLRSNNPRESDHEARACCAARATPQAPRRRRSLKGVERPFGPSLRSALVLVWTLSGAERSDGPCGCSPPLWPCREAQGLERAHAPQDACASWSCLLRLSERSERSERSEFRSTAPGTSIAGCPQRSEGSRPAGSPFFGSFLWRDKERDCAAGRISRPAESSRNHRTSDSSEQLQRRCPSPPPSPQRGEGERLLIQRRRPSPQPSPQRGEGARAHIRRRRPLTPAPSPKERGCKNAPAGEPSPAATAATSTSLISMVNKIRTS